jgi:hypothetical protein
MPTQPPTCSQPFCRNQASAFGRSALFVVIAAPNVFDRVAKVTKMPSASQNPPHVENAVAPNTLRLRNSHIPARSWIRPP